MITGGTPIIILAKLQISLCQVFYSQLTTPSFGKLLGRAPWALFHRVHPLPQRGEQLSVRDIGVEGTSVMDSHGDARWGLTLTRQVGEHY